MLRRREDLAGGRPAARVRALARELDPWARRALALGVALAFVFALSALGLFGHGALHVAIARWLNAAVGLLCAAICLRRWQRARDDRLAWLLIGAGISSWAVGNAAFSIVYADVPDGAIPTPSFADVLWLALYPLVYAGIVLLARRRHSHLGIALWLDGWVVGLAGAALLSALVVPSVVGAGDSQLALATNLAYPLGDLVLCLLVIGILLSGIPRGARGLAAGVLAPVAFALSDAVYVAQSADGSYRVGGLLDLGWLAGLLLAAYVASVWSLPAARLASRFVDATALVPIGGGLVALALLADAQLAPVPPLAVALAAAALLLTLVRTGLTLAENRRAVASLHHEARTDALTGLGNRRRLFSDLARACARADHPIALVVFDLDGFKTYNDTFGHTAGDQLLRRLAGRMRDELAGRGRAYRLGGDELCAIVDPSPVAPAQMSRQLSERLVERGSGFVVTASHGCALFPDDAQDPGELLRHADRRMYDEKHSRRPSAATQAVDALLATVQERHPALADHVDGVTGLARELARRLGLADADLDAVIHAAALHDVGKVAIPDAILKKPGPLSRQEWAFMRRHTLIGERILRAVPALRTAAPLVRWSHERWDGRGYPDGLHGTAIPLGAAIVAACDAFDAMTEDRPYQAARPPREALAELRRCSGTQFDPRVVPELVLLIEQRLAPSRAPLRRRARGALTAAGAESA